jgi:DNA polymerase III sliding clamp (beta) subunit (PCNA family)
MPITGGSAMEFETKRQRNNYFGSVNTIINDSSTTRPEWAKVPITFTEEEFRLKSTNHNDAMVIEVNIAGWVIGKILVDNGSSTNILSLLENEISLCVLHFPIGICKNTQGNALFPDGL